jgi:N-acetylmuramoyl-L-alanine amidase
MAALETLLAAILARWSIAPHRVIGHSDMAPQRKSDPGRHFDWRRLARQGLSVWPDLGDPTAPLVTSLTRFGYPDAPADIRLAAFRLRFRPWATGPEDATDRALAQHLAQEFGQA